MRWLQTNPEVGYDEELKKRFEADARKLMKEIESHIPLITQSKIKFNKAGVAVSGDVSLTVFSLAMGYGIYITLHTPSTHGLMFRKMNSVDDSTGGPNCWLQLKDYKNPKAVAEQIMNMMRWIHPTSGELNDLSSY